MIELLNKVYHNNFLNNGLPDKSVQLIIADPPYFQVKGDFDFIWGSFEEYLGNVESWAIECKRLLADNGSLFWYGHAKKIAYTQIILDKYFNLENNLVWDKGSFMGLENSSSLRSFAPCTERILFYSNEVGITGLQFIDKEYIAPRNPFAIELRKARIKKGVSINQVAEYGKFYGNVNHGGSVSNWEKGYNIPSKEQWEILCENLPIQRREYEYLRREYEYLRREYEDLRRPFNNIFNLQEVIKYKNEQAKKSTIAHDHDTIKPEALTTALIQTTTKKNDIIFIPFAGSGTECAMAIKTGRRFIAYDVEIKYVDMANKRVGHYLKQGALF